MIMYYIYNMRKTILIFIACMFRACMAVMAQVDTSAVLPTGSTAFTPSFRWQSFGGKQLMWEYNSAKGKYYLTATLQYTRANFANLNTNIFTGGQTSTGPGGIPSPIGTPGNVMFQDANFSAHLPASAYTAGRYPTYTFWIDGQDASGLYFRPISEGANLYGLWLLNINGTNDKVMLTRDMVNYVPSTRSITINGVTQDLSADRTFTVASSGGSVTNVSSTTTDISVTNPSTTPTLTLNSLNGVTKAFYDPTSSIQTQLNGKQPSLGFTPENVANKSTSLVSPDNTKYPTTQAVATAIAAIPAAPVQSVFGRTGTVTALAADYSAFYPQLTASNAMTAATTTGATQTGNTFNLNATAIQNNGTYNTVTFNAPTVTLGSFTGQTLNAAVINGNANITGTLNVSGSLTSVSNLFSNSISPISNNSNISINSNNFSFGTSITGSGEFIIGNLASNRAKLQISGATYGSNGIGRAISVGATINPAYSNESLIGLDLSLITFGNGAGGVLTTTEATSGTATLTSSNVVVNFTGGTGSGYRRVVSTVNGSATATIQSGGFYNSMGSGYTVGDVLTGTINGITITETITAVGLTGTKSYDMAMKTSRVLQAPSTLLTTPIANTTEYDGTRLYQTTSGGVRSGIAYVSDGRTPLLASTTTMVLNGDYLNTTATQYTLTLPATTGFTTDGSKIITALSTGTGGIIIRVPSGYSMQSGSSFATTTGTGGATLTQGTKVQLIPIGTNSFYLQPLNGSVTLY